MTIARPFASIATLVALVQQTPEASCPRLRFFRFDPREAFALRTLETEQ